jgi:hypothetical protein
MSLAGRLMMSGSGISITWRRSGLNKETAIQNAILIELSKNGVMAWRNHVGKFRALDDPQRLISVGVPGMADIIACVPLVITQEMVGLTIGAAVGIEVKTKTGKQRKEQLLWELALTRHGGVYTVLRDPKDLENLSQNIRDRMQTRSPAGK